MRMLEKLFPDKRLFFDSLAQLAGQVTQAAEFLEQDLATSRAAGDGAAPRAAERIAVVRREADALAHAIDVRTDQMFIPPLDREDIHAIATHLRKVADEIGAVARQRESYRATDRRESAVVMAGILRRATEALAKAVSSITDSAIVIANCQAVRTCRKEGDAAWGGAVGELFERGEDPIRVLAWKDLYDLLQVGIDECEAAANALEAMAVKHTA